MNCMRAVRLGLCLAVLSWTGVQSSARGAAQEPPLALEPPAAAPEAIPPAAPARPPGPARASAPVVALTDGPVHEAFLSPAKNEEPTRIDKAPPVPIAERPAVDAPNPNALWVPGYW